MNIQQYIKYIKYYLNMLYNINICYNIRCKQNKGLKVKYLKNMINNIMYLLKHDLVNNNHNRIKELEKIINENYQTLMNKCIDNKNTIIDINSRLDDMCYDIDDKMSYDGVVDCINDNNKMMLKNDNVDIMDERKVLINECINVIINRLSINSGQLDDNDNV